MAAEPREREPQLRPSTKWPDHPPRPEPLLATIRRLCREGRISYLDHSEVRMAQRGFDVFDVRHVLAKGHIVGGIQAGKRKGEWTVKVVDILDEGTSRKAGVVTIVVREERLLIKTVEWEDT